MIWLRIIISVAILLGVATIFAYLIPTIVKPANWEMIRAENTSFISGLTLGILGSCFFAWFYLDQVKFEKQYREAKLQEAISAKLEALGVPHMLVEAYAKVRKEEAKA